MSFAATSLLRRGAATALRPAFGGRRAMSGDAATLDELASLASTIGSIVFVVYVCMTAVNLFLATAESVPAWESNCRGASPPLLNLDATHSLISAQVGPRLLQELPHDS